jgi:hypothetical protein
MTKKNIFLTILHLSMLRRRRKLRKGRRALIRRHIDGRSQRQRRRKERSRAFEVNKKEKAAVNLTLRVLYGKVHTTRCHLKSFNK